jgi:hypothetical protein
MCRVARSLYTRTCPRPKASYRTRGTRPDRSQLLRSRYRSARLFGSSRSPSRCEQRLRKGRPTIVPFYFTSSDRGVGHRVLHDVSSPRLSQAVAPGQFYLAAHVRPDRNTKRFSHAEEPNARASSAAHCQGHEQTPPTCQRTLSGGFDADKLANVPDRESVSCCTGK